MTIILAIIFTSHRCEAQDIVALTGGLNQNKIVFTEEFPDAASIAGFFGGLSIEYNLSDRWKAINLLEYAQKGGSLTSAATNEKLRNHVVDLGLGLEYRPIKLLGIYGGPTFSYLFSSQVIDNTGNSFNSFVDKGFLYGGMIGGRIYVGNIAINLQYARDIKEFSRFNLTDQQGNVIGQSKAYMQSIQVGMILYL